MQLAYDTYLLAGIVLARGVPLRGFCDVGHNLKLDLRGCNFGFSMTMNQILLLSTTTKLISLDQCDQNGITIKAILFRLVLDVLFF